METSAGSVAAGVLVSIAIYVFFNSSDPPRRIVADFKPATYSYGGLQTALLSLADRLPSSLGITPALITAPDTELFVVGAPKKGTPPERRKQGDGLDVDDYAEIVQGKAILLDLGNRLPAAVAPAAAGGGTGSAAAAAAAPPAAGQMEALIALFTELKLEVQGLIKQTATKVGNFSAVRWTDAVQFFTAAGLHEGGHIAAPSLSASSSNTTTLTPFRWGTQTEPQASSQLRALLRRWTCTNSSPPIDVHFFNTEPLTKSALVAEVDGVARYTGVPDVVTLGVGLDEETVSPFTNASSSWDWKTSAAFAERKKVAAQAVLQLIAFSRLLTCEDNTTHPVFFTDMATGVRCWIMIKGTIYHFHPANADLSLAQGIHLLRYFIYNNGRLAARDWATVPVRAAGPQGGSGGSGSGGASGPPGPFTPGPKPSGGGGGSAHGGTGASPFRDAVLGKGPPAAGGSRQQVAGGTLQSQQSSPGDPSWTAADDLAVFQMELVGAALTLQACGVDVAGVYDPSV